jgi:hypothetical protein
MNEQSIMINEMKFQTITFKTLFETKKNIDNLEKFLINTEIVTRKWILENTKENKKKWTKNLDWDAQMMKNRFDCEEIWSIKLIRTNIEKRVSRKIHEIIYIIKQCYNL